MNFYDFLPKIELPFTNPVVTFAIVLIIILLSPIVLKRFKIPGIVGLIISGMIIGPNGLNLLAVDSSVILFGTIGLLYIMFLAGVELDLNEFRKNKFKSIFFGLLIFVIASSLGFFFAHFLLKMNLFASILIGAMSSTFTLVSYPIVSRLGLVSHRSIVLAVGGVILTDLLALIVLVLMKSFAAQTDNFFVVIKILISLSVLMLLTFVVYPKIAKWYFKNIEEVGTWQFIFVLALLFTAAFLAQLLGFEPIIGAFAAGLALNPIIPKHSSLMDRLSFFGNSIFIPFFLIQVGMIINIGVIVKGWQVIEFALMLTISSMLSKWIAAYIIQKSFSFSSTERNFLFGVSVSQAAALIAIVLVGYQIGILEERIFNSSILIVLITSLVSSFFTEYYGRKLVIEKEAQTDVTKEYRISQKILVTVANPQTISRLIEFGLMIKKTKSPNPLLALTIIQDEGQLFQKLSSCEKIISQTVKDISPQSKNQVMVTSRINLNISSGISGAIKENLISDIVLGMHDHDFGKNKVFGNVLQKLTEDTNQTIYVVKNLFPMNTVDNILVLLPENIEYEPGFRKVIDTLSKLSKNISAKLLFYAYQRTNIIVNKLIQARNDGINFQTKNISKLSELENLDLEIRNDDMLIACLSRPKAISYNVYHEKVIEDLLDNIDKNNVAVIYPEQNLAIVDEDISHYDILETSPIQENLVRISTIKNALKKLFSKNNKE
ncbi:MAG: hypothetical protein A2X64_01380 [Ignavibacteria bacterium GWF2_33_9]|nr:MAG: hypothetical protein A2X64_01380 [Ignavibacteria bacterium GWF2_33_9]